MPAHIALDGAIVGLATGKEFTVTAIGQELLVELFEVRSTL